MLLEESHIDCGEIAELEKEETQIEGFETVKEIHNFSYNSSNQNSSLEDVSSLILEDIVHDLSTANSCENIEPDQENLDFQVNINCRKSALSTLRARVGKRQNYNLEKQKNCFSKNLNFISL